jgi:flagellar biosynthesis protein
MNDEAEIAIALKYDKEKDAAPRVIAKGMRLKAEKIREIAREYKIPILKNIPLANALYRIDVGQEVPEELYDAVAEVLNFVYALQQEQQAVGQK